MLKSGISKVKITPPLGLYLAGYGFYLDRKGKEVNDDLYARAVLFDDGTNKALLIVLDLCGVGRHFVMQCREEISASVGIPAENITISCTHTHSGPLTVFLRGLGEIDKNYMDLLKEKIVESAKEARKKLEPVMVGAGQGKVEIGYNRVVKDGLMDTALMVLRIDDLSGKTKALLYNYSAHAVVGGGNNLAISADWPGYTNAKVDADTGGMGIFLQGFCGDINVKDACTDLFEKAREHGENLAGETVRVSKAIKPEKDLKIKMRSKIIDLPLHIPSEKDIEDLLQRYVEYRKNPGADRFFQEWKVDALREISRNPRDFLPAEVQILAIGNDILFAMEPGEMFTKWGLKIKKISAFKHTFVIGYANDFVGYIPDEDDFARYGYAADMVPPLCDFFHFKPNVGEVVVEGIEDLISIKNKFFP